jgi:hypothetical protein
MSENNNWPGKPGVPLNPERDGWHWVQRVDKGFVPSPRIVLWTDDWASGQFSWDAIGYESASERKFGRDFCYIAPVLTPAEVDARIKEARRDALEEAARVAEEHEKKAQAKLDELTVKFFSEDPSVGKASSPTAMIVNSRKIAAAIRALKGKGYD